tara:strand:- start:120 stop:233 length:114 start_codon:yes stop_codon:yes gene_type:complete
MSGCKKRSYLPFFLGADLFGNKSIIDSIPFQNIVGIV